MKYILETEYLEANEQYKHLFEISTPPINMIKKKLHWQVRDDYKVGGTLMVGDLLVTKTNTKVLESHPFPEWVVQIYQPGVKSRTTYCVIPNLTPEFMEKVHKQLDFKEELIQERLEKLTNEDYLIIEYRDGVCIKIPPFVPHEFITIDDNELRKPYCQVFEPDLAEQSIAFGFDLTSFYLIPIELSVESEVRE